MKKEFDVIIENKARGISRRRLLVAFEGHTNADTYGTGLYISVSVNGLPHAYLDCRYERATFDELCEVYIKNYWGENLKSFEPIQ